MRQQAGEWGNLLRLLLALSAENRRILSFRLGSRDWVGRLGFLRGRFGALCENLCSLWFAKIWVAVRCGEGCFGAEVLELKGGSQGYLTLGSMKFLTFKAGTLYPVVLSLPDGP